MVRDIVELGLYTHTLVDMVNLAGSNMEVGDQEGYQQQPSYLRSYKCLNNNMVSNASSINSSNFMSPSRANNMDYSQVFLLFLQFNHLLGEQQRRCSRWENLL